jgi:hypothetical protein
MCLECVCKTVNCFTRCTAKSEPVVIDIVYERRPSSLIYQIAEFTKTFEYVPNLLKVTWIASSVAFVEVKIVLDVTEHACTCWTNLDSFDTAPNS